jgi:hypothetical protein
MTAADKIADLCWGQRYIWLRHHQLPAEARHEAHIVLKLPVSPDAPMTGLRTMLNYLIRRHEALRTTYQPDADGVPRQRVHPPRGLPLITVDTEAENAETPAEVIERLSTAPFELAAEWPIRACLVLTGGRPNRLVLVLNHMAFDAWTVDRFEQELSAFGAAAAAGRQVVLPPVRHQPVDLAQYEASPAARAEAEHALDYWRAEIRQLPSDCFGSRRATAGTAHSATLTSPELLAASRRIAAEYQVWPSAVHLTGYAMLTAAYAGTERVSTLAFTGNRNAGGYPDVMTCMFSPLLMRLDCPADASFADLLAATADRFEQGQRHSYLPYDELLELVAAESDRRGEPVRLGSEFNFLSRPTQQTNARRSRLVTNPAPEAWSRYGADCYLRMYELRDAAVVSLQATVLDAAALAAFLRGYERLLLLPAPELARLRVAELAEFAGFAAPPQSPALPQSAVLTQSPALAQSAVLTQSAALPPALSTEPVGGGNALAAAVAELNGLPAVDPARNYVAAGGRVLRIPAVLDRLAAQGWTGLAVYDLAGGLPLAGLAGRLVHRMDRAA